MNGPGIVDLNEAPANSPDRVVAIDFDGVITDPHGVKAEAFATAGYDISPAETSRKYCLERKGIPEATYERIVRSVNTDRLHQVPLREGVQEGLETFSSAGYCPVVVTSRYDDEVEAMRRYIDENGLNIYGYINTDRMPKRQPIADLDPEVFIDDSQEKLKPILETKRRSISLFYFRNEGNSQTNITVANANIVDNWRRFVRTAVEMSNCDQKESS